MQLVPEKVGVDEIGYKWDITTLSSAELRSAPGPWAPEAIKPRRSF